MNTLTSDAGSLTTWHAWGLVLGLVGAQYFGSLSVNLGWMVSEVIQQGHLHVVHGKLPPPNVEVLAFAILAGMLMAAAWAICFLRLFARPLLREPGATGIAWRQAAPEAYVAAALLAVVLILLVIGVEHAIPPDPKQFAGPLEKLSRSHGLPRELLIFSIVALAPPLEELVFRGIAFAIVANRFGIVIATIFTTGIFVLLHTAEKIHYWPGFIFVGCLALAAVFLRLRYRSLWPGIFLHMSYNALVLLLS